VPLRLLIVVVLVSGCYEISHPAKGYQFIDSVLDPVIIAGKGGETTVLLAGEPWQLVAQVDNPKFLFIHRVPFGAWHCDIGTGCATRLQVEAGGAIIYHDDRIGQDMHVCTVDYVQTFGRAHCYERRLGAADLDRRATTFVGDVTDAGWQGDYYSRLTGGWHSWQQSNDPWHPAEQGTGAEWTERPWVGELRFPSMHNAHNVDLGACSVFVPWKWEDRDPALDYIIGPVLDDRGLAELTLDELDAARAQSATTDETENVIWFFDAFTSLWPRDIPSEFHYHVKETGERQACLRSYFATNTDLRARPGGWNFITEAIATALSELFGIGDCKTHPMSVRFCGDLDSDAGAPVFMLDESSIVVDMEPYSRFKPSCNNSFVPLVKQGLADGVRELTDSAITSQLEALTSQLPFEIRRIELVPSGAYLVVAESYDDPQFDVMKQVGAAAGGDPGLLCRPDLGGSGFTHDARSEVSFAMSKRGITR
jgi:hypothetical protein